MLNFLFVDYKDADETDRLILQEKAELLFVGVSCGKNDYCTWKFTTRMYLIFINSKHFTKLRRKNFNIVTAKFMPYLVVIEFQKFFP